MSISVDSQDYFTIFLPLVFPHFGQKIDLSDRKNMNPITSSDTVQEEIIDRMNVGVFRSAKNGELIYANPVFIAMFGMTAPQGMGTWKLSGIAACEADARKAEDELRQRGRVCVPRIQVRGADDRMIWVRISLAYRGDSEDGPVIEGMVEDATDNWRIDAEARRQDEERRQARQLESIGRLAGGVAHDFNNLLTAINGYSELLLGMIGEDDPFRENLLEIKKAGTRAAHLTRELLAFSRRQMLQPRILDLNETILSMEPLIRRTIGDGIEVENQLDPRLGKIKCDPGQMENVIMNLIYNARDAMPYGGKIILRTGNTDIKENPGSDQAFDSPELPPGAYATLTLIDSGTGMEPETLSRIFEPFFTTKPAAKAAGMGLATVHGIVKQSGGHIFAESDVGAGTVFRIHLPRFYIA
jgi:signal transduction histidine kinase